MGLASCPGVLPDVNFVMIPSPPLHYQKPPPMRPSKSLEGLEKVIPPGINYPTASTTDLHLNKPLPPRPQTPDILGRTTFSAWSDDSSIESFDVHSDDPRNSTESFPIFVSSGSEDLNDFVDPSPALESIESTLEDPDFDSDPEPDFDLDPPEPARSSFALNAFLSEERYGISHHPSWGQNRNQAGANHYFREKKWDFFPELATPVGLSNSTLSYPTAGKGRRRVNLGLDFARSRSRWTSENAGAFAHGVRDSIRSYVSRTLSKGENKSKRSPSGFGRPVTSPSIYQYKHDAYRKASSLTDHSNSIGGISSRRNSLDTCGEFGSLSISTHSSMDNSDDTKLPPRRRKQLAVPLSPYQKYGARIWDKSGGPKKVNPNHGHHHVRFPNHSKTIPVPTRKPRHENSTLFSSSMPSLPLPRSPTHTKDYVKALQDRTNQVRDALDDAKRRMSASKASQRREQLKSRIKLVGPVNPYTQVNPYPQSQVDPWL